MLLPIAIVTMLADAKPWKPEDHVQYSSRQIPNRFIIPYHDGTDATVRLEHEAETHNYARSFGGHQGVGENFHIGDFSAYLGELHPDHVEQLRTCPLVSPAPPPPFSPAKGLEPKNGQI